MALGYDSEEVSFFLEGDCSKSERHYLQFLLHVGMIVPRTLAKSLEHRDTLKSWLKDFFFFKCNNDITLGCTHKEPKASLAHANVVRKFGIGLGNEQTREIAQKGKGLIQASIWQTTFPLQPKGKWDVNYGQINQLYFSDQC